MLNSSSSLGRLERVDLRSAWASESGDFTPWLAQEENVRLLGETIGIELEVEAEEKYVGPFRADILCKDITNDSWVLIENQLERTDHSHLGQLITYAAGLQAKTIIWIASRFTDEHRAALDWLNEIGDGKLLFFGLEVELWRIGDSPMAPKFNVVSSPNDWSQSVTGAAKAIQQGDLSESQQRYFDFWTMFGKEIETRKSSLRVPKPSGNYWKNFSVGKANFSIVTWVAARDEWIGVQLSMYGDDAKTHFKLLEVRRVDIETAMGQELEWRELPNYKESQIRLVRKGIDPKKNETWPEICDWLIVKTEKFLTVFRPIVRELDVSEVVEKQPIDAESSNGQEDSIAPGMNVP